MEIPKLGQWTFESENIAKSFDAHVREQLPFYDIVTNAVVHIVSLIIYLKTVYL